MSLADSNTSNNINENRRLPPEDDSQLHLRDADDYDGVVPDDALQKVNPAAAARVTPDHDPHHVAKSHTQYNTDVTQSDK